MIDFLFGGPAPWFTVPAAIGTVFFAVRLGMLLIGTDSDFDLDTGGGGGPADHHADSDQTFKVLSVQSVAAFLMGFGWAGLGGLRGSSFGIAESIGIGLLGGAAMVWLLGWLLKMVYDLQTHGNIAISSLVGLEGDVYVTIPARDAGQGRTGRVRVVVRDRQRFYPGISSGPEIPRGGRVRVLEVAGDRTLVVQKL